MNRKITFKTVSKHWSLMGISGLFVFLFFTGQFSFLATVVTGYTKADVSVGENGESRVRVPISIPNGTIMTPEVGIVYSSQSGNGLLGTGFELEGIHSINRVPATRCEDNFTGGINFDQYDRFSLDGQRLISLLGNDGVGGAEYRTEQNTFSKVISNGQSGNGPLSFTVYSKDGLKMEYGNTSDSRIEAKGKGNSVITWLLNKATDTKGNYFTYSYIKDTTTGEYCPDRILYTGNSNTGLLPYNRVQFLYESVRKDTVTGYYNASSFKFTKRLSKVEVYEADGTLFRQYQLDYQTIGLRNISHLKSVTECGSNNECFPPTVFNWIDENVVGSQSTLATSTLAGGDVKVLDIDADGKQDIIVGPDANNNSKILKGSTNGFTNSSNLIVANNGAFSDVDYTDLNMDGLPDFVGFTPVSGGNWKVQVKLNQNGFFSSLTDWYVGTGWSQTLPPKWIIDINADGFMDIVFGPDASGEWRVLKNTGNDNGNKFELIRNYGNAFANATASSLRPIDFNGDGLTDFIHWDGNSSWYGLYNTSTGFINIGLVATQSVTSLKNVYTVDLNNDGLTDILLGPNSSGDWKALISNGKGFINKGNILTGLYGNFAGRSQIYPTDLNADGFTDVLLGPDQNGAFYYLLNDGSKLINKGVWLNSALGNYWNQDNLTRIIDYNGDGMLDICFGPDASGNWYSLTNKLTTDYPHLLKSVTTGNGTNTEFNYDKLTNPNIYSLKHESVGHTMNFIAPIYVVSAVKTDNGLGNQNKINYKYENAQIEMLGRGFRGYAKMYQIDSLHQTVNITFYNRNEQYTSTKIDKTEHRLLDGRLIYEADNTEDLKSFAPGWVRWSFVNRTFEKWYELDGTTTKTKTTNYEYDNFGNPTRVVESYNSDEYIVENKNTYLNDSINWRLGRLLNSSVTKTLKNKPAVVKTSSFEYEPSSGLLISETTQPESATQRVKKIYTLDAYGNQIKTTTQGPDITDIVGESTYDSKGRFMLTSKNPLGQVVTYNYTKGFLDKTTDPNGLTEQTIRDGFGRPTTVTHPDGKRTFTTYQNCNNNANCFPLSYYVMTTSTEGGKTTSVYYDKLDREVAKTETAGFNTNLMITQTTYNQKGETLTTTEPYAVGTTPLIHTFEYDILSRQTKEIAPANRISTVSYNGLTTVATNPENQTATKMVNAMGWLISSKDNQQNALTYEYDSDGNNTKVIDPAGNQTTMTFDIRGFRTGMLDPDFKSMTYTYDCLGRIKSQNYADGRSITMEYDKLSRKTKQIEPERTLEWVYDQATKGVGKLALTKINGTVSKTFTYDNLGRMTTEKESVEGSDYTTTYAYDDFSRLSTLTYPVTGFSIKYKYDTYGQLQEILRGDNSTSLWKLDSLNNQGQVQNFSLGNGLKTRMQHNAQTGFLESIQTGNSVTPTNIQYQTYSFTPIGNITQRKDVKRGLTENFEYDNLNRVTKAQVVGQNALTMTYDKIGNITKKSDVGTYKYGENGAGPHMVTSIDNAGITGCSSIFQGQVTYNSYNYPIKVVDGKDTINLTYDENRKKQTQRLVKKDSVVWKKYYINAMMEKVVTSADTKYVHYIYVNNEVIATYESGGTTTALMRYLHKDHLGSMNTITTESGDIAEAYSYDVWGKPRAVETWKPILVAAPLPMFQRGYTFHEMLGIENLILMESRVYDPNLARFLSPDPFIPDPEHTQSLNRATYVFNNPLSYTDPSGFLPKWAKKALKAARKVIKVVATVAVAIVAAAALPAILVATGIATASSVAAGTVLGTVVSGAGGGFGSSFAGTLLNGGNIGTALRSGLKGAAIGAVSAGLTFGVGEAFGHVTTVNNVVPKMIAHGVVQGGVSAAQGGSFASGFAAGALTSGASLGIQNIDSGIGRIAASAVVGGTASRLTGGSFANGAVSGAFVEMYNGSGGDVLNALGKAAKNVYDLVDGGIHSGYLFGRGVFTESTLQMDKATFNDVLNNSQPKYYGPQIGNGSVPYTAYGGKFAYSYGDFTVTMKDGKPVGLYDFNNYNKGNRDSWAEPITTIGRGIRGNNGYDIIHGEGLSSKPNGNK